MAEGNDLASSGGSILSAREGPEQDREPANGDKYFSRRILGLAIFFLVSSVAALVVWWLALHSPVSFVKIFEHFAGIDEAADSISVGFLSIGAVCLGIGVILLLVVVVQASQRRISGQ